MKKQEKATAAKAHETTSREVKAETTEAPPPAPKKEALDRGITKAAKPGAIEEHMKKHGLDDPWSAYNAGGTCGVCGEKIL